MKHVIEKLMNSEEPISQYFPIAKNIWEELLEDITSISVADLAGKLAIQQSWFFGQCGGYRISQEIMVWTGFASIYNVNAAYNRPGRGGAEAIKLAEAFKISHCSIELLGYAHEAAMYYGLAYENGKYYLAE